VVGGVVDVAVPEYLGGISIISQEAPMFQDLAKVTAIVACRMVAW